MANAYRVFLCFYVCLQLVHCQFAAESDCTAANGGPGKCMNVLQACQPMVEISRNTVSNPVTTWMLRKAHCGFDGNDPKICCPLDNKDEKANLINVQTTAVPPSTLPSTTLPPVVTTTRKTGLANMDYYAMLSVFGETCTTVYNTTGACKDVYICDSLMPLLNQAASNPAAKEILRKAHCGFKNNIPQVCCPVPGQPTSLPPVVTTALPSADSRTGGHFIKALPEPPVCGWSNTSLDRVVGGVPAKLGAFPWMAVLAYNDKLSGRVEWKCGGSLISIRHVLTAAHCIHTLEDELFKVRLGELDLSREDEGATPIDIPIAEMIKHESYTKNKPTFNDIGILVLQRDVEFTDLIRPICLFVDKELRSESFEDNNPFVAGWGLVKYKGVAASHLQVAGVPVLGDEACGRAYGKYTAREDSRMFLSQALCAGFPGGKIDSCKGDSGGPLMQPLPNKEYKFFFYEIGVVSLGYQCAVAGSPGIYARVTYYMPWIEEHVLGRKT